MKDGFKSLIVWQKAMVLVKAVYNVCDSLPQRENFALADQLRRAAVSVPSNIAEGTRRTTRKDYVQFLSIAHGSLAEVETQLLLIQELYPKNTVDTQIELTQEVSRMLYALIVKLKN